MENIVVHPSPQEKDRRLQLFLAQARGPRRNGDLLRQSVDLVLRTSPARAAAVAARLRPRFYAPDETLVKAAAEHGFANVVDGLTGLKTDFSFAPENGFLAKVLERRIQCPLGTGSPLFWMVTPEDVILMKLVWRKGTRSSKQWDNALGVARVKGARMDWNYLHEQAHELGIEDDLARLRDDAGI